MILPATVKLFSLYHNNDGEHLGIVGIGNKLPENRGKVENRNRQTVLKSAVFIKTRKKFNDSSI